MRSHYADTPRETCFYYYMKVHTKEYCFLILKLRLGARNIWQNTQQLCGAMIHIFDNDTSGIFPVNTIDGAIPMWVV